VVVDTKSKASSSSSSGSGGAVVYASSSISSSGGSKKWIAYVMTAGLLVGIGGTAMLAQQTSRSPASALAGNDTPRSPPPMKAAANELGVSPRNPYEGSGGGDKQPVAVAVPAPMPAAVHDDAAPGPVAPVQKVRPKVTGFPLATEYAEGDDLVELQRVALLDGKALLDQERPLLLREMSPKAKDYAKALVTRAYCKTKDQTAAQSHFRAVTDSKLRAALMSFCADYIGADMLK
jgi:hypothetical protein